MKIFLHKISKAEIIRKKLIVSTTDKCKSSVKQNFYKLKCLRKGKTIATYAAEK